MAGGLLTKASKPTTYPQFHVQFLQKKNPKGRYYSITKILKRYICSQGWLRTKNSLMFAINEYVTREMFSSAASFFIDSKNQCM